jgi:hypothetical protein
MAIGVLELLWNSCYEAGDDYVGTAEDIDAVVGWPGEPGVVALALVAAGIPEGHGFIEPLQPEKDGDPMRYRVHDLWHHAPEYVTKRRKRESERRQRSDPSPPNGVICPPNGGHWRGSPVTSTGTSPPSARGAGAGEGSGSISEREGGAGETFRYDVALQTLQGVYPQNRVTFGHLTTTAFVDVLDRADSGDPEAAFGRMLSNLANQKKGAEWRKGMIPKLENWLRSGACWQVHEAAEVRVGPDLSPDCWHEPKCADLESHKAKARADIQSRIAEKVATS